MAGLHAAERFPMQSVYKIPIAMAVLNQVDKGLINLETRTTITPEDIVPSPIHSPIRELYPNCKSLTVRELIRFAIVESDGTASDVLLKLIGGPKQATAYVRNLGIAEIMIETTEKEMAQGEKVQYRNHATPRSIIKLLQAFQTTKALSPLSRSLLLDFMIQTGTGPRRIKGLLPRGTKVAHKTGASRTVGGLARATNDAGIVTLPDGRHLLLAVFVSDSKAGEAERDRVIARIAKAAWDHWTTEPHEPSMPAN